ncbi:MAG: prepilin-type N-terminal cleavage/methylation domain-containing protein [Pseudomonadota bacterium]
MKWERKGFSLIEIIITMALLVGVWFYYQKMNRTQNGNQMGGQAAQKEFAQALSNAVVNTATDTEAGMESRPAPPKENDLYQSCRNMGGGGTCAQLCNGKIDPKTKACL